MNVEFEKRIKEVIKEEMTKYADEIITEQITILRKKLAEKSDDLISKVIQHIMVSNYDDPVRMRSVIQLELSKIVIVDGR